jgi:hypothetical protein
VRELILIEILVVFLLGVQVLRPLWRSLYTFKSLNFLPPFALIILICIVPAYGLRYEMAPLLIFAVIVNLVNLERIRSVNPRQRNALHPLRNLLILAIIAGFTFYFAPARSIDLTVSAVQTIPLNDDGITLRLYRARDPHTPLMILIPPLTRPIAAVDAVADELRNRGFTVALCVPVDQATIKSNLLMVYAFLSGTSLPAANDTGVLLEEKQQHSLRAVLSYIASGQLDGVDTSSIFITGYGAGGSAAVLLSGEPAFTQTYPAVHGIIAIESRLWSLYQKEERPLYPLPPVGLIQITWYRMVNWFIGLFPPKLVPQPLAPQTVPVLFLASNAATKAGPRSQRYRAVIEFMQESPSALIAVPGAGILDYSDYPAKYPIISMVCWGGIKTVWKRNDFVVGTAALISNFAALFVETGMLKRTTHSPELYLETKAWNTVDFNSILFL